MTNGSGFTAGIRKLALTAAIALAAGTAPMEVPQLRFDTFVQALRAAENGAGVLLASLPLAATALSQGSLTRLSDQAVTMEGGYWISWDQSGPDFAERNLLVDLICVEPRRAKSSPA